MAPFIVLPGPSCLGEGAICDAGGPQQGHHRQSGGPRGGRFQFADPKARFELGIEKEILSVITSGIS
jgi:hypothetical protein